MIPHLHGQANKSEISNMDTDNESPSRTFRCKFITAAVSLLSVYVIVSSVDRFSSHGGIKQAQILTPSIEGDIKTRQIENYKRNESLILNLHITHCADAILCRFFRSFRFGTTPSSSCIDGIDWPSDLKSIQKPWRDASETNYMTSRLREHYTMIEWGFSARLGNPVPSLSNTSWENPNLISILVMRNPMGRLLAGDGDVSRWYGGFDSMTPDQWWDFASNRYITNNFALTILAGNGCCDGENTSSVHLETAKKLVSRFTFVLDQDCLNDGLIELANVLGEPLSQFTTILKQSEQRSKHETELTAEERINNATLYKYLLKRNHYDIELYEWSKTKSLVKCADLHSFSTPKKNGGLAKVNNDKNATQSTAVKAEFPNNAASENSTHDQMALVGLEYDDSTDNGNGIKMQQIENYKRNESLVLNVHITHHAGTFTCAFFRQFHNSKTPSSACMNGPDWPSDLKNVKHPWRDANETSYMVSRLREHYTMTSWEFSARQGNPKPSLSDTHWEDPNLVSVIVMRNPMDRLLAGDGDVGRWYGGFDSMTPDQWWEFASDTYITNNFALTVLAGNGCCDGENTSAYHLETAKKLVSRFTVVIDQDCLTDGFIELANVLGEPLSQFGDMLDRSDDRYRKRHELTAEERINNSTLYEYLLKKNHYDIELYEWSKTKSLVKCADILSVESDDNTP